MNKKIFSLLIFTLFIVVFSSQTFALNSVFFGRVINSTGSVITGINVTVKLNFAQTIYSNITNSSGHFYMNLVYNQGDVLELSMVNYSDPTGNTTYKAKKQYRPMPASLFANTFSPGQDFVVIPTANLYFNAWNGTTNVSFGIVVSDQATGVELGSQFSPPVNNFLINVDKSRNLTVMIFQMGQDTSASGDIKMRVYQYNNLSLYSGNPAYIPLNLSIVPTYVRMSGYITAPNTTKMEYTNLTRHFKISELRTDRVMMSFMVPIRSGLNGDYQAATVNAGLNTTSGFYNISMVSGMEYVLFATGNDSSTFYGGYFNQTTSGLSGEFHRNLTLAPLRGFFNRTAGMVPTNISRIQIYDDSYRQIQNAFVQVDMTINNSKMSYELTQVGSNTNEYAFAFVQGASSKIRVYSSNYEPTIFKLTEANLSLPIINLTLTSSFRQKSFNGTGFGKELGLTMYASNSTCDVPNEPPLGCLLSSFTNATQFSPLKAQENSDAVSIRIKHPLTNMTIHYIGVDMSLSGPPSASFDESSSGSGATQKRSMGSVGPQTYSGIIVGIPYDDTNINEATSIYANLPTLYDDDLSTVLWNTTVNSSTQIPSEFSTYNQSLFTTTGDICSTTNLQLDCYVNTTSNIMWVKIPHFSGSDTQVQGSVSSSSSSSSTSSGSSSSSSGGATTLRKTVIEPEKPVSFDFYNHEVGIDKLEVTTKETINNALFSIKSVSILSSIPSPLEAGIASNVYKYFEVNKENINDAQIASVKILFTLKKSWLENLKGNIKDVVLLRYEGTKWVQYETVNTKDDNTYYYFQSTVPGLSTFGIALKAKQETKIPAQQETITPPVNQPENNVKETSTNLTPKKNNMKIYLILLAVIFLTIGLFIFFRNKPMHHRPR